MLILPFKSRMIDRPLLYRAVLSYLCSREAKPVLIAVSVIQWKKLRNFCPKLWLNKWIICQCKPILINVSFSRPINRSLKLMRSHHPKSLTFYTILNFDREVVIYLLTSVLNVINGLRKTIFYLRNPIHFFAPALLPTLKNMFVFRERLSNDEKNEKGLSDFRRK